MTRRSSWSSPSVGFSVGVGASILLDRFRLVPLPGDVYLMSHVPFAVHPLEVVVVALFAFGTAILAGAGVPTAMLFVRSLNGGISHSPQEESSSEDVQLAVEVLAGALARLT